MQKLFFISIVVFRSLLFAQWQKTAEPYAVKTLFANQNIIYAGTWNDGVYISSNKGESWTGLNTGLSNNYNSVTDVFVMDTSLFAAVWGEGIYLSTDNGSNWVQSNSGLQDLQVYSLATMDTRLFASASNGVYKSYDDGKNWEKTNGNLINVTCLLAITTGLLAGTSDGIFITSDYGQNWKESNNGLVNPGVTSLATSGSNIYAGTGDGVFLSTNRGENWSLLNLGSNYPQCIQTIVTNENNVFAGTCGSGIYKSTNNGQDWQEINEGLTSLSISSLSIDGNNIIAGTNDGIFITDINNILWKKMSSGILPNAQISSLLVYYTHEKKYIVAGTYQYGIFISANESLNWSECSHGLQNVFSPVNAFTLTGNNLFVGIGENICVSTNYGQTWEMIKNIFHGNSPYINSVNKLLISGTSLFAGTNSGIYCSTDNGLSWNEKNIGLTNTEITSLAASGSNLFAGTWGGGICISENNGESWTSLNNGLSHLYIRFINVCNSKIFTGTDEGSMFLSSDNGTTWVLVNESMKDHNGFWPGFYDFICNGEKKFAATTGNGVYLSENNDFQWTEVNTGLPNNGSYSPGIFSLAVSGSDIYAAVEFNGVWKRPISEIVTSTTNRNSELPIQFKLKQNYPNPFNPTTTIEFSIPEQTNVTLKIFDLLGREIMTLMNEEKAPGNYQVEFDGSSVPSGVYFYRLEAGQFIETKEFIFMK